MFGGEEEEKNGVEGRLRKRLVCIVNISTICFGGGSFCLFWFFLSTGSGTIGGGFFFGQL